MLGLLLGILIYELDENMHYYQMYDTKKYPDPMDHPRNKNFFENPLRIAIASTSFIAIIFVIRRHIYQKMWLNEFYIDTAGDHNIKPSVYVNYNENIWGTERKSYLEK